jgi:Secretion system C-terminal sorting domain
MKKFVFVLMLSILLLSLNAENVQPDVRNAENDRITPTHRVQSNQMRDVPDWEFNIDPVNIITNYYDYMPGSYNSFPIRIQSDDVGGGIYVVFHGRETAASTRREYYAYIDADGNVTNVATISTDDLHEGYAGMDIDPLTGDPIVSWHVNIDTGSADNECVMSYDLYHLGSPGLWKTPFIVIDESIITADPADEFEWPYIYIGPSPVADKQRVYIVANNAYGPTGSASENVLIGWSDFDTNDLNTQSEFDWNYYTIPLLDEWNQGIPEWVRPFKAMAVSDDGMVALIGYTATDGEVSTIGDKLICLLNDNYGEGDYIYFEASAEWDIPNPQNQDGTYRFLDENGQPQQLYMEPYLSHHQNAIFTDGNTKLKFPAAMNMMLRPASWYPDLPMLYPKMFTFDLTTEEFSFQDMYIEGADPYNNVPMLPWDLDEDGVIDEFDVDGYVTWEESWPIYHFDNAVAFHENNMKITQNEERGWLCAVWSEGLKSRLGNVPEPGYEDWAEYPEICITVSGDNGGTWQDPIIMNAKVDDENYVPELDGMIPSYVYVADKIEDLGDGHALVHLFFYDDNSYGSSIYGHGENLGGTMIYAAIDIDLYNWDSADPTISPAIAQLSQNYPNPFNPSTTISYEMKETGNVILEVFNVKGQKVKTLIDGQHEPGTYTVDWNGNDNLGKGVSSGVYFYKMRAGNKYSSTKKMIMLK